MTTRNDNLVSVKDLLVELGGDILGNDESELEESDPEGMGFHMNCNHPTILELPADDEVPEVVTADEKPPEKETPPPESPLDHPYPVNPDVEPRQNGRVKAAPGRLQYYAMQAQEDLAPEKLPLLSVSSHLHFAITITLFKTILSPWH